MKKLSYLFLALLIILFGCNDKQQENLMENKDRENVTKADKNGSSITNEERKKDEKQNSEEEVDREYKSTKEVESLYRIHPKTSSLVPIANADKKVVLLTIDDAPDKYSLDMAKTLKEQNVKAIFFVNGHFIDSEEEKEVLKKIFDMGFAIGNHTWNHKKLPNLTEEQQKQEIVRLSDEIENITGERPIFFRAPHGLNTDVARQIVADEKMVLMNWSYGYDYFKEYMEKDALADIMVNTHLLRNGANLLMHDREWTNAALEGIVIGLEEKGFTIIDPALIEKVE